MARCLYLPACLMFVLLAGCRSPYVDTSVINSGTTTLHNVEVDYPSASFGMADLAAGAVFHYRFQIQDAGRMKVEFSNSSHHNYTGKGPYVAQGQQGTLQIMLDGSGKNQWSAKLRPAVKTPKDE